MSKKCLKSDKMRWKW